MRGLPGSVAQSGQSARLVIYSITMPRRRWNDDQLRDAVASSVGMAETIRKLGLSDKSVGNRGTVKKYIEKLGLDNSHWLGQGWTADPSKRHPTIRDLSEILVEGSDYKTSHLLVRLVKAGIKKQECESCGLSEWMGKRLPLEIDHINGISNDHRVENLMVLCPNCHALTPTWRGKKNKGRKRS